MSAVEEPEEVAMSVGQTILAQLGGRRFVAMTGARNLCTDGTMLHFSLPGGGFAKDGINKVRIELDPSDTYTVRFYKIGRAPRGSVEVVYECEGVYEDMLREMFEERTGLRVSL